MPVNVGVEIVPNGVIVTVPFVPLGVPALTADVVVELPVKVSAGIVPEFPVNVKALLVPDGIPALTAEVVFESPVNVGAETVPLGT